MNSFIQTLKSYKIWSSLVLTAWIGLNIYVIIATTTTEGWQLKEIVAFVIGNALIGLAIYYCSFLWKKAHSLGQLSDEVLSQKYRRSMIWLGFALLIIPFFFIIHVPDSAHNWDFFEIFNNTSYLHGRSFVNLPFTEDQRLYFMRYPNNQFFGILYNFVFAPFSLTAKIWLETAFSALLTSASVLGGSVIIKTISDKKFAYLYNLIAAGFVPFYIYGAEFYTDTFSLPFVVFGLLFLTYAIKSEKLSRQILWAATACLILFFGYNIKPTVIIPFIAVIFFLLLKKKWKKLLVILPVAAILFVGVHQTVKVTIASEPTFSAQNNDRYNLPLWHWLAMSFYPENKWGGFNPDVLAKSEKPISLAAKTAADKALLIQDFKRLGFFGTLQQLWRKINYTWFNGDLSDFFYTYRHENPVVFWLFDWTSFAPKAGNITGWLLIKGAQTVIWIGIVFFMFYEMGRSLWHWKRPSFWFIPSLSILGLSLFLLIWEANSRYLYNFAPIMILLATAGMIHFISIKKPNARVNIERP